MTDKNGRVYCQHIRIFERAKFVSTSVTAQMQMATSTTLILQLVIVYGTIHVMSTTEIWLFEKNEKMQAM